MEVHLDSRGEQLIEQQLRSGRFQSAQQVVLSALEALTQSSPAPEGEEERRRAVRKMLEFAGTHGLTLRVPSRDTLVSLDRPQARPGGRAASH